MEPLDEIAARLNAQLHDISADETGFAGPLRPGEHLPSVAVVAHGLPQPLASHTGGAYQCLLFLGEEGRLDGEVLAELHALLRQPVPVLPLLVSGRALQVPGFDTVIDAGDELARLCDARPGTVYLLGPDRRVVARWRSLSLPFIDEAIARYQAAGGARLHTA